MGRHDHHEDLTRPRRESERSPLLERPCVTEWLMKHAAYGNSKARTGTGCEVWPGRRGLDRKVSYCGGKYMHHSCTLTHPPLIRYSTPTNSPSYHDSLAFLASAPQHRLVQPSLPLTRASQRTVTGFALRPSPGAATPCRAPLIMGRSQKHEEVRRDTPPPFNTVFGVTAVNIAFFLPLPVNWRDRWTVSASAGG